MNGQIILSETFTFLRVCSFTILHSHFTFFTFLYSLGLISKKNINIEPSEFCFAPKIKDTLKHRSSNSNRTKFPHTYPDRTNPRVLNRPTLRGISTISSNARYRQDSDRNLCCAATANIEIVAHCGRLFSVTMVIKSG